jgi:mRNA interferase MazF
VSEARRPRRGEVWELDLEPVRGQEQGGRRPALVISNDHLNRSASSLCVVVPISRRDRGIAAHLPLDPPTGGLTTHSVVLCDQFRTVSIERLLRRRGEVGEQTVRDVLSVIVQFLWPVPN